MFSAFFKKQKIIVQVEKELEDWEMKRLGSTWINYDMTREIERRILEAVKQKVVFEIDNELVAGLAKELLANFDFKAAVEKSMQERVQEYLNSNPRVESMPSMMPSSMRYLK